jgi:beta-N-acetylhexosaminidase
VTLSLVRTRAHSPWAARFLSVLGVLVLTACTPPAPAPVEPPETVVLELLPPEPVEAPRAEPEPVVEDVDPLVARIDEAIAGMDVKTKVAGLMVVTVSGLNPAVHRDFLERIPTAGFLLGRSNLAGDTFAIRDFIAAVQKGSNFPLVMAVDQEGSPVARIAGDEFPGARVLGATSVEATAEAFLARQKLVDKVGANVNFGVVADVSGGPGAYIDSRSFSTDPAVVAQHVVAAVGAQVGEVAQTLKHFPGHGMVLGDSHRSIPRSDIDYDQWRSTHAVPFMAGMGAGAELLMMGHLRVPAISADPASLSDDWVAIARKDLGFDGVIITDDLRMLQASGEDAYKDPAVVAVAALVAGNDMILMAVDPGVDPDLSTYDDVLEALVQAVTEGVVTEEQLNASLVRVLSLRAGLGTP